MRTKIILIVCVALVIGILPNAPVMAKNPGLYVSGELINWKARRHDMDFLIVDPNTDTNPQGNQANLNYGRNCGARVVLGYNVNSRWDFSMEYQTYAANDHHAVNQPAGGTLWATRVHPDSVVGSSAATSANASASLDYDVLDFTISRHFSMDRHSRMDFTLFGGFRYAMIDQNLDIDYIDAVNNVSASIRNPNKLDGYGIRLGGKLDWNVHGHWNVFGKGALSVLAARSNTSFSETDTNNVGAVTLPVDVSNTYYQAVPVLETALGVAYRKGNWELAAGYEMGLWGNVGERRDFGDDVDDQIFTSPSSDLVLDGFFFRLAFNR